MTFLNIVVDDTSVEDILQSTERAISGPSLLRFLEGEVSEFFRDDIESRFNEEGDALAGFWPELKDVTVDIKRASGDLRGSAEDINVRTGRMFDELTGDYDSAMGADWASLQIPGNVDPLTKQKIHTAQRGSNSNPLGYGPTPPRPVLATSEMQLGIILEKLEFHIIDMLVGSFIA